MKSKGPKPIHFFLSKKEKENQVVDMHKQRIKFIYELLKDASAAYSEPPKLFFLSALIILTVTEHRDDEEGYVAIILSLDHALDLTI